MLKSSVLPGSYSKVLQKRYEEAVPTGIYHLTPLYVKKASGAIITDVDGNQFIDFAGGIGMQNVGHCHPKVVRAVQEQAKSFIHPCFHVTPYENYIALAEKMNEKIPGTSKKKTMFANSGAEAIENAVKIARKVTGRSKVISFERGFHGRTLMTMSLSTKENPYKAGFGPFVSDMHILSYPYYYRAAEGVSSEEVDSQVIYQFEKFLEEVSPEKVAAIVMEPVQGEGGFIVPSILFVKRIREICDQYGILMIMDEVQTGFGRTGKWFATEHFNIEPDIIALSKSIAGGLPLSAIVGRAEFMDVPGRGQIGGTFAGSPLSCAAGLAVFEIMEEENLVERAQQIGNRIMSHLHAMQLKYEVIGDVRGIGAMVAMELVTDRITKEPAKELTVQLIDEFWKNGLISIGAGIFDNVLRFLPPLVISNEEIDKGFEIINQSFKKLCGK
ncbi:MULTISPECIES: 4-aminobutyrate--2-oxoglutarate transaminase [Bacillus]|uniref:4-aminobutyrate--2-oxoglutarate transaminase n=1 Tax=Bacillus TaxID=1386 RepID=UPI000872A935|nr:MULTISPECIES: 4-aminobutyrate--2-oxoglutarate transaminase [Bacillus cereus group]MBJ8048265.1 4-aminobutyrate--2-oxoglutarate transaminase [Bacillus cereus group sp. N18]MCU5180245.1 4-aminobutyrate--2-oxoglutarate transaminase [Bacillus toyonensis]MCU5304579.1 4-aminobutyrate--2-oxoglutarate transaminase [Bacillus toyonensis]PDZ83710.1 4-aminobutyrate--2-oxoglutarate transaminase [Bacillus toyonensis]PEA30069.1 4-aminobutyrate--2-oxoglutarate transaminase [Bacillus toyonensis]